jgi:hypothetical protein
MEATIPGIRKENGNTLVNIVLSKPIDVQTAGRISTFCNSRKEDATLIQDCSEIKSYSDGHGGKTMVPKKFPCKHTTAIVDLGNSKYGNSYILEIEGEDEDSRHYAEQIYLILPTAA